MQKCLFTLDEKLDRPLRISHVRRQTPPLCSEIETEKASIPFDARGRDGWDVDSVVQMTESMEESEGEEE